MAGEQLVEIAGRVCYMSFARPRPGGNKAYLGHILEVGHGSVLEHAVWNFVFTGVSRSLTHELVRHRAGWAYSQLSQRYVDESVAEYVEPDVHRRRSGAARASGWTPSATATRPTCSWSRSCRRRFKDEPDRTLRRKLARQAARSVLPNATETKIFVTANARALRHFIELRGSRHAEVEIRKLAVAGAADHAGRGAATCSATTSWSPCPTARSRPSPPHRKV